MPELQTFQNLINGKSVPAESGRTLDVENPATGEVWATIPASSRADAAAAAAGSCGGLPCLVGDDCRGAHLLDARGGRPLLAHGDELATLECRENGFPVHISKTWLGIGLQFLWHRMAALALDASTGRTVPLENGMLGLTRREPYGVVAAIVPWNAPVSIMVSKTAAALAAGNTVVVKPPEQASAAILRAAELIASILPPGVVNFVSGTGEEVGDALVRHRAVRKITMTGSCETGRAIQRAAADTLTPSVFELGGKSPNIVFADANLDAAAKGLTTEGIFTPNAGQGCVADRESCCSARSSTRWSSACELLLPSRCSATHPMTRPRWGRSSSKEQYDKIVGYLELGNKEAKLLFGGKHGSELVGPELAGGYWVQPTLFTTTDNAITICQEEIFGPVAVAIPFDTEEEAVAIANDSAFGLASGVWTSYLGRAHRMINAIQSGQVWVNTYLQTRLELPVIGSKDSGYGHDDPMEFSREKAAVIAS